ncbi:MAG: DEAD/DEAH box helicase [Planctomycetes bacterium]|nr:DEAD/DEAH box helicase [Planctomycetota bacterium]
MIDRLPSNVSKAGKPHEDSIEILAIHASTVFEAVYRTHSEECLAEEYLVFVSTDWNLGCGCSCSISAGRGNCLHTVALLRRVHEDLASPGSQIAQAVSQGRFSDQGFQMVDYIPDSGLAQLGSLDRLIALPKWTEHAESIRVDRIPHRRTRVVWHIERHWGIGITPYIQVANKKGNGWNRSKEIEIAELWSSGIELTESDKRVRKWMEHELAGKDLPVIDILEALVGQPNVFLSHQHEEVDVSRSDGRIVLHEIPKARKLRLCFREETQWPATNVCFLNDGIVMVSEIARKIAVARFDAKQTEMLYDLRRIADIPAKHRDVIFQKMEALQTFLNVELPSREELAIAELVAHPVMLLKSFRNGVLEYGLRVRDGKGRLHRPGQGVLFQIDRSGDAPTQWVRSAAKEIQLCQHWRDRLGIEVANWDGAIEDFFEAMTLVNSLQTPTNCAEPSEGEAAHNHIEVLWDPRSESKPQLAGTIGIANLRVSIERKRDWFQLAGECLLGESSIGLQQLLDAIDDSESVRVGAAAGQGRGGSDGSEFVRVGDLGWAKISTELRRNLKQLRESVHSERKALKFDHSAAIEMRALQQRLPIQTHKSWEECLDRVASAQAMEPTLPGGFAASLRDYQFEGYRWMRRLCEWGVGGVLADDMGLGKTVQTLGVLLDRAGEGPSLVIAPTSVGFNWMRETERFAPGIQAFLYRETDRDDFLRGLGPNQLVVASYGLALRDIEKLKQVDWNILVLDEAQAIKNGRSKTSKAIADLGSKWKVALTGTPVENHLGELWSLFHTVAPGVFGSWDQFRIRFASPIERDNDPERRDALRKRLMPFVLRRTKKEVLRDLPLRTDMNLMVELSPAERKRYDAVRATAIIEAETIAKSSEDQEQRFRILAILTRLRQLACHPRLVDETWSESSAKLDQLKETLLQLREEGHRVLVFSQFVQHLQLIRAMLDQEGITYQYLDGSTPAKARQSEVDRFQNGDADVFLISLKAGGTGLNLTAADYVIHMDPWWNPAVEDQATDRAHRIGQTKPVMVYRIIAQNTIEEEILKLHETKRDLIAGVLDGAESAAKLTTADLIAIIRGEHS